MAKVDLRKEDLKWKHNMLANAEILSKRFPNVKEIVVEYKKQPFVLTNESEIINGKQVITPNDRFCVHINCINDTCIGGGWNIEYEITKLINAHKNSYKSEICQCGGWRDKESRFYCYSEMQYEISIEYFE